MATRLRTAGEGSTENRATREGTQRAVEAMRAATAKRDTPISGDMVRSVGALLGGEAAPVRRPGPLEGGEGDDGERGEAGAGDDGARDDGARDSARAGAEGTAAGEVAEGEGSDEQGAAQGDEAAPETWDELADYLGLSKADLYKIAMPLGDGKTATLGELKDSLKRLQGFDAEREEWENARQAESLQGIDDRRRMAGILQRLAQLGQLPRDLNAQVEADHKAHLSREHDLLRRARPEWADPTKAEAARAQITDALREYGISAAEVGALDDHRFILAAQDFARMKLKLKAARDAARRAEQGQATGTVGRSASAKPPQRRAQNNAQAAQIHKAETVRRVQRLLGQR